MKTALICFGSTLVALCGPASAFAQAVIPPTGEPPPPEARAAEQAAIEKQTHETMAAERRQQIEEAAAAEVDAERYAAWDQRGRDQIPPAVSNRYPTFEFHLLPRIDLSGKRGLGTSLSAKLRIRQWGRGDNTAGWGIETAGGYYHFGDFTPAGVHTTAAIVEPSTFLWLSGSKAFWPDHALLRVGVQNLIPITSPARLSYYIAPFAGFSSVFAFRSIAKAKGFVGITFDLRVGRRVAIGATTGLEVTYGELLMGLAMGI